MPKHFPISSVIVLCGWSDHLDKYDSSNLACKVIGPRVGIGVETLRRWAKQARVDAAQQPRATSAEKPGSRSWSGRDRELREANEILKSFFAGKNMRQKAPW